MAPSNQPYDYSTLESAPTTQVGHSTLEYYDRPPSTFEGKEAYIKVNSNPDDFEAATPKAGFWDRRVCGMGMKLLVIATIILLLLAVGGAVSGTLGTQKKDNNSISETTTSSLSPTTTDPTSNTTDTTNTTTTTSVPSSVPNSLFTNQRWMTFDTPHLAPPKHHTIQASYDKDRQDGAPAVKESLTSTSPDWHLQQWQFYAVPDHYPNCTVQIPGGGDWIGNQTTARAFWISNREYGPDVRLVLYDDQDRWLSVAAGTNTSMTFPELRLRPKDLSNEGQYWFALPYLCGDGEEQGEEQKKCAKFHNVKSGLDFRIWGNKKGNNGEGGWEIPAMGTGQVVDGAWDAWDYYLWEEISANEGGFTWTNV